MDRRRFLQASGAGLAFAGSAYTTTATQASRDLVTHAVAHNLSETPPLLVYSGLRDSPVTDPLLAHGHDDVTVSIWNDWNDRELQHVFAAFIVESGGEVLGSYRIYDTPDIAFEATARRIAKIENGYVDVAGMRANKIETDGLTIASLRLWNVVIGGVVIDESTDIMLGLVKHLGQAIDAFT